MMPKVKMVIPGEMSVTEDGQIIKRDNRSGHKGEWTYTRGRPDTSGHYYTDYLRSKYYIHQVVAHAFVPIPEELEGRDDLAVHHLNEDKSDNSAGNLGWIGHAEHSSLHKRGALNSNAKLSEEEVKSIRGYQGKRNIYAVAKEFGVSKNTIYRIWSGEGWKNNS